MKNRKTTFVDSFSEEIYVQTYKYHTDNDVNDTHRRIAKDLASVEKNPEYWEEKFLDALEDFKFVPGGRINSNAGTGLKGTTYINCFVDGFTGEGQDSMNGIMDALKRQAMILKSEGGYGFCADVMRPRGAFIEGIGVESPGAVKMLDMWDKQSEVITAGSGEVKKTSKGKNKIRKGAQMVTMSCWHPSIEEFITAKQTPGRLTKFNMSVLITDELMKAVEEKSEWKLEFPDTTHEKYDEMWDGNLKKWKENNLPVITYKTFNDANELWDLIMKSTYNRNEPGVLFVDTMNKMNNLKYCEYISATNPCGEQILPIGGVCLLGSINLTQFVDLKNKDWDYEKLKEIIPIIVRLMDNVNDKTHVPLPSQKENLINKRRIGLGYMGYASALLMMKVRYGSKEALALTDKLGSFVINTAYQASSIIAKEKGSFKSFDADKYLDSEFVKMALSKETQQMIRDNGLRNSHLASIQPTGNSSIYANNVSGGLEPIFMPEYIRTSIVPHPPKGMDVPVIDFANKSFKFADSINEAEATKWEWVKEGDENLLLTKFEGSVYKIDQSRGLLKETKVQDYGVRVLAENGEWDSNAEWAADTYKLNIDDHVTTMKVFAKYIDSAMSKTINLPNNYPYEDFKRLYKDVYETGIIKGATTYRAGTMTAVLSAESTAKDKEKEETKQEVSALTELVTTTAPKRPKKLPCDIYQLTANSQKWMVFVGLMGKEQQKPYEVFAFRSEKLGLPSSLSKGTLVKSKNKQGRASYDLECEDGWTLRDLKELFESDEQEALTRMISTALRHGADPAFVVEQLQKSEGTVISFSKAVARTLKKYIKEDSGIKIKCSDCGSKNVSMQEGCFVCVDCGSSKCS